MKEQSLMSWEEFESVLLEIDKETEAFEENTQRHVDYPLFRGQSNSNWHLESTLDRTKDQMTLSEYHRIMRIVHTDIATCTGKKWDLNSLLDIGGLKVSAYEFMVYLRHNGFPSPLLDWTRSPYVAAYFAFSDTALPINLENLVSIFVYRESIGHGKAWWCGSPHIRTLGPTIITDPKHYLQQSEYSLCVREEKGEHIFAEYKDVQEEKGQDIILKYNIPVTEQKKVLRKLNLMNITAYSLFNSEISLSETLYLREFFLK